MGGAGAVGSSNAGLDGRVDATLRSGLRRREEYVVPSTLDRTDWNAELVRGDLGEVVRRLKREPGKGCSWEA
jgi:hypothetical protein